MPERWLLIHGGTVIDGTGQLPSQADVLVEEQPDPHGRRQFAAGGGAAA